MLKKIIILIVSVFTVGIAFSSNEQQSVNLDALHEAIDYLYAAGLTKYDTIDDYGPQNYLRRDEAAKMVIGFFHQTDQDVVPRRYDRLNEEQCDFEDLEDAHSDLLPVIQQACEYYLLRWFQNKFMPTRNITNGEFLAIMIRMLSWYLDESAENHWATSYFNTSIAKNLLTHTDISSSTLDTPISRGNAAIVLKNIYMYLNQTTAFKRSISPDLLYMAVSLDANKPAPRLGDTVITSLHSFANIWWKELLLDSIEDMIRCTDDIGTVVWTMAVNTYRLDAGASDGYYHIDLFYEPTTRGINTIFCSLDPDNVIIESDEDNNSFAFDFYVEK